MGLALSSRGLENRAVAIVGMAVRVPGAHSLETFWYHIVKGTDCLTRLSPRKLRALGVSREILSDPAFVASVPSLEGYDQLDVLARQTKFQIVGVGTQLPVNDRSTI